MKNRQIILTSEQVQRLQELEQLLLKHKNLLGLEKEHIKVGISAKTRAFLDWHDKAILKHVDQNNSEIPTGIVVMEDVDDIMEKLPYDDYKRIFMSNKEYYKAIIEESYVLTPEQFAEVYGDDNYLMNVQLEETFRHLIGNEFRYRSISQITVCKDISNIYKDIDSYSQIKIRIDQLR